MDEKEFLKRGNLVIFSLNQGNASIDLGLKNFDLPNNIPDLKNTIEKFYDALSNKYGKIIETENSTIKNAINGFYNAADSHIKSKESDYQNVYDALYNAVVAIEKHGVSVVKDSDFFKNLKKNERYNPERSMEIILSMFDSLYGGIRDVVRDIKYKRPENFSDVRDTAINVYRQVATNVGAKINDEAIKELEEQVELYSDKGGKENNCDKIEEAYGKVHKSLFKAIKTAEKNMKSFMEEILPTYNELKLQVLPIVGRLEYDSPETLIGMKFALDSMCNAIARSTGQKISKEAIDTFDNKVDEFYSYNGKSKNLGEIKPLYEKVCDEIPKCIKLLEEKKAESLRADAEKKCLESMNEKFKLLAKRCRYLFDQPENYQKAKSLKDMGDLLSKIFNRSKELMNEQADTSFLNNFNNAVDSGDLENVSKTFESAFETVLKEAKRAAKKTKKSDQVAQKSFEDIFEKQILSYFSEDEKVNFKEVYKEFSSVKKSCNKWYKFMRKMCSNKIKSNNYNKETLMTLLLISCCAADDIGKAEAVCRSLRKITKNPTLKGEYIKEAEKIRQKIKDSILKHENMKSLWDDVKSLDYGKMGVDKALLNSMLIEAKKAQQSLIKKLFSH